MYFKAVIGFLSPRYGELSQPGTASMSKSSSSKPCLKQSSLLILKHLDSRLGSTLCTLGIHSGYNPTVDNMVVIPNTFGSNICTNQVSEALHEDIGKLMTYTQRRATLHARRSMALSTTEDRP
jgi:hypothetical protein